MATRRTTFDKLQRERAKRAKQTAKREERAERKVDRENDDSEIIASNDSPDDLLARIEDLHKRFDAKQITFEDFEAEKVELFERLAALPME